MKLLKAIISGIILTLILVGLVACGDVATPRSSTSSGWMHQEVFYITPAGSNGWATGTGTSDGWVAGHLYAVQINYGTAITPNTDITLTTVNSPAPTIFVKTDSATDAWYYPAVQQTDATAAGTSTYDRFPVNDYLYATVTNSTADAITVTVYWGQ